MGLPIKDGWSRLRLSFITQGSICLELALFTVRQLAFLDIYVFMNELEQSLPYSLPDDLINRGGSSSKLERGRSIRRFSIRTQWAP